MNGCKMLGFIGDLSTILPIANSHMVNFITHKLFDTLLPKPLQDEILALNVKDLNNMVLANFGVESDCNRPTDLDTPPFLKEFLQNASKLSLKQSEDCISFDQLCEHFSSNSVMQSSLDIIKHIMSTKKSHEVEIMSSIISVMAKNKNCTHIIDIGDGKGYLSSILSLKHNMKVLSIDSSTVTLKGAAKQMPKVERLWKRYIKKTASSSDEGNAQVPEEQEASELCKLATMFVRDDSDVMQLIVDNFPGDNVGAVAVVGLHTCGNLAASSLRLFNNNPDRIKCLVNVGCCYHLITEQFAVNPSWLEPQSETEGFPMSECLQQARFALGRNARMLAAQPPDRISQQGTLQTEVLFYRALLEVYLEKKLSPANGMPQFRVGKMARKCTSFKEYVQKSIKRLGLEIEVEDAELEELVAKHSVDRQKLHAFFLLRLALAPAIEAAVLLDRLLFLREQGRQVFLTQLFDPVVSPRCYAIIAFNQ